MLKSFLNPEGHQNRISGLQVTVILLKELILSAVGDALGRVCAYSLRSMGRGQHTTHGRTSRLLDQIGLVGRFGGNLLLAA